MPTEVLLQREAPDVARTAVINDSTDNTHCNKLIMGLHIPCYVACQKFKLRLSHVEKGWSYSRTGGTLEITLHATSCELTCSDVTISATTTCGHFCVG